LVGTPRRGRDAGAGLVTLLPGWPVEPIARREEARVSIEAEMVTIPRADLDALQAELRRLRREAGDAVARERMLADPGPGDNAPTFTGAQLAEAWGADARSRVADWRRGSNFGERPAISSSD
jgi:hypothetical protein